MITKAIRGLLLAGLLPCAVYAQETTQFIKAPWKELLAKAKQEHKPIFVDTYFEGCHACKEMDVKVFPSKDVKEYMQQNFINTGIDVFKEDFGYDLCSRYMLHGFPTFLVISPEGKLVDLEIGFNDADRFLTFLKNATSRYKNNEFHDGFSTEIVKDGPDWYQKLYTKNRMLPGDSVVIAFLQQQKDKMSEISAKAMSLCRKMPADYRSFYLQNRKEYIKRFGKDLNASILDKITAADLKSLPAAYDLTAFNAFIGEKGKEYGEYQWTKVKMDFAYSYLLKTHKKAKEYIEFAIAANDKNGENLRMLSFYAYDQLSNPEVLTLLLKWADSSVNEHSSLEVLRLVGMLSVKEDKTKAKQYLTWAVAKATMMGLKDEEKFFNEKIAAL